MNMFESEVAFLNSAEEDNARLKQLIWADDTFREYVAEVGLEDALYAVTDFHRNVANQLKAAGIVDRAQSEWGARAIGLCMRLKSRRQQLRRAIREAFDDGDEIVKAVTLEIEQEWA